MSFNPDNFNWRPNDNSSKTLHKYSLEAERWTEAFKSANRPPPDPMLLFNVGGSILTLILCATLFIMYGMWYLLIGILDFFLNDRHSQRIIADENIKKYNNIPLEFDIISPDDPYISEKLYYQQMAQEHEEKRRNNFKK